MKKNNDNLAIQNQSNNKSISQNNLLALLEKTTNQNVSKRYSQNELFKAENVLKGYVNNLKEQAYLSLDEDEVENLNPITQTRRKNSAGSSLNLRSKKIKGILKKKDKDELKKPLYRRMSYNDNNSNRFLFIKNFKEEELENSNISINEIKENKINDSSPKKFMAPLRTSYTVNNNNPEKKIIEKKDPLRKRARFKSEKKKKDEKLVNLRYKKPKKSLSKVSLKKVDLPEINRNYERQKSSDEKNPLFSLLKTPTRFEGEKEEQKSIADESQSESLLQLSGLSNKNILQLNEISKEFKRTIVGESVIIDVDKNYLSDDINLFKQDSTVVKELDATEKEKYRILTRKGYVYDSFDDEENIDCEDDFFYIHPDSFIVLIIDVLVAIFSFYNLIAIPFKLGFNVVYCSDNSFFNFWKMLNLLNDVVFIFDFGISFFIAYYNFDEVLQTYFRDIIKNYLNEWFLIDLITSIPFQTIFSIYDKKCHNKEFLNAPLYNQNFYYLCTLLRLLKIFKVNSRNKFIDILGNELVKFEHLNRWGGLMFGFLIFSISLHIVACSFIFIGRNDYPSWIINFNHDDKTFLQLYIIAIYYTITTLTTVGYGDLTCVTPKEKIFGLIIEVVGIFAYSWALTAMSNYVKVLNEKTEELSKKCKILDEIKLSYPKFPDDLYDRIIRFLKYKQFNEKKDKNIILDDLPITLRNSLIFEMYKPIINSFIFFKNFSNSDFIVRVILAFNPILALKNDLLIKDGDLVEDIIFVKRGTLALELPINITPPKHKPSINKRNSIANLQQSTLFFNNLVKETQIGNNLRTTNFGYFQSNTLRRTRTSKTGRLSIFQTLNSLNEENKENNIQKFKILEIRKNEHFGDILMFLNQRSPLCLKVKSKKAELFYLNKADALDISTSYPQYWKKINKKSLFNMEQIKRLMNRVIKIFRGVNGMFYSPLKFDGKGTGLTQTIDILENEESDLKSIPSISEETENNGTEEDNAVNNNLSRTTTKENGTVTEHTVEDEESIKENTNNFKNKKTKTLRSIGSRNHQNGLKTIVEDEINYESSDNKNSSSMSESGYEKKSYGKTSTYSTKKMENIDRTEISSFNKLSDDEDKKYTKIISNKSNYNNTLISLCTPYKPEEINNEIYPEENFIISSTNGSHQNVINNIIKPVIDNMSICSTEISFSINSEYDNIDELSDYKFSKNPFLRKRVRDFIKDEIGEANIIKQNSIKFSKTGSNKNNIVNNYFKAPTLKSINKSSKLGKYEFKKTNTINNSLTNPFKRSVRRTSSGDFEKVDVNKILGVEEEKKKGNKKDILDVISHNIEKNVMNLNNPDQFYSEFFLKFMDKKKSKLLSENGNSFNDMKKEEKDFIHKMEKKGTLRGYETLKSFSTIRSKI